MKKATTNQFEHNGVAIQLLTNGHFAAHVKGVETRATTLAAMKKKIDAADTFVPFKCVQWEHFGGGKFESFTVVGTTKNPRRYRVLHLWVDDKGRRHETVTPDTALNRKAMQDAHDKRKANGAIERKLSDELVALEAKVEEISVESKSKASAS